MQIRCVRAARAFFLSIFTSIWNSDSNITIEKRKYCIFSSSAAACYAYRKKTDTERERNHRCVDADILMGIVKLQSYRLSNRTTVFLKAKEEKQQVK